MWLVVGLGNPGTKYERNRHNIGFLAVEKIAGKLGASLWTKKFQGEICEVRRAGSDDKLYFLKPQTFMNLSGESVAAAARFYKIPPENIVVLHDELDIADGKLKVKQAGGDGGHNGIRSIDAHMGKNYHRVRIGIGHPGDKDLVSHYVLSDFSREEWDMQQKMINAIAGNFTLFFIDAAKFMNKVALEMSPPMSTPHPNLPPLQGKIRMGGNATTELAQNLRRNMTEAEKKLWYHLRRENLSGCKFRRQQPLGPYIADFACLEKKLIVQVDGSQHVDNAATDAVRTDYIEKTGHKVLRFRNNEVMENIEGVLEVIDGALQNR